MPLIYQHPQTPPGGHQFPEAGGHVITANSVKELIALIESYRLNNAMPAGNPELELELYYTKNFPWLVQKTLPGQQTPPPPPASKEEFIMPWLNRLWRNPPRAFVEAETTRRRLAVCDQCPFRIDAGKVSAVAVRRLMILAGRTIDPLAPHCSAHSWACEVAARIESPEVLEDVEGCWAIGRRP